MPLIECPDCTSAISDLAVSCPHCGRPLRPLPQYGYEYRSRWTLFGLPLVHIATGVDPVTGLKRVAKGIIAFGDIAIGVLAFGGIALGGITFGGVAVGLLALAGVAIGGVALGGTALGVIALGGAALGYYAIGGAAIGAHVLSPIHQDADLLDVFKKWLGI
jgi:hypothetical protein